MSSPTVEILVIGSEVLAGDVLDTNSHWLCRRLAVLGARVTRITALPDDTPIIAATLAEALGRQPALILTCGGLGPTADDRTVAAVAAGLGRPLAEDPEAWEMVRATYAMLHKRGLVSEADMSPPRAKMARLPAGAWPLVNSAGAAPGVLLTEGETAIACLPGVPAEMKAIFEESLWPRVAARLSGEIYGERALATDCWDESQMAPAVDVVSARHPRVYVKSRAQVYGAGLSDFVTLAVRADTAVEAAALLDAAEADLRQELVKLGVRPQAAPASGPTAP